MVRPAAVAMFQTLRHFFQEPLRLWSALVLAVSALGLIITKGFPVVKEWVSVKKEIIETKKVEIELAQLQKNSSKTIDLASLDEVRLFDPKTQRIFEKVRMRPAAAPAPLAMSLFPFFFRVVILIAILAGVIYFALKIF
jgi:hypothetical protein